MAAVNERNHLVCMGTVKSCPVLEATASEHGEIAKLIWMQREAKLGAALLDSVARTDRNEALR